MFYECIFKILLRVVIKLGIIKEYCYRNILV